MKLAEIFNQDNDVQFGVTSCNDNKCLIFGYIKGIKRKITAQDKDWMPLILSLSENNHLEGVKPTEIVSTCYFIKRTYIRGGKLLSGTANTVENFYVVKEVRRTGVATKMINYIENKFNVKINPSEGMSKSAKEFWRNRLK